MKSKARKLIIAFVVILIVIGAGVTSVLFFLSKQGHRSIKVEELAGESTITEKQINYDAYEGMNLKSGQEVIVKSESSMTLLVDNDKYLYADECTRFSIKATGSEDKANTKTKIVMQDGSVLYELRSKLSKEESFTVETPNTAMTVRGTTFYVSVYRDENNRTYTRVEVEEGAVQLTAVTRDGKKTDEALLEAGSSVLVQSDEEFSEFIESTGIDIESSDDNSSMENTGNDNETEDTDVSGNGTSRVLSKIKLRQMIMEHPEIASIQFESTLVNMTEDAVNISVEEDGGVWFWLSGTTAYIGAEGKVVAPADCRSLFEFSYYDDTEGAVTTYIPNLSSISFNGNFDTGNVTNMEYMFAFNDNLGNADLTGINTSGVTNMESMFANCGKLGNTDFSSFNTSNVTNMKNMFSGCKSMEIIDLSSFNTSNVTNMEYMFSGCDYLVTANVGSFDTSRVTTMQGMFSQCKSLKSLNVSSFNTANVTDLSFMFANCISLEQLDTDGFVINGSANTDSMYSGTIFEEMN